MSTSASFFDLPLQLLELLTTYLNPFDVFALRLVSRQSFHIFASPHLCAYLLSHHFPFALRHRPTAYDTLNSLLLRRRRLLTGAWSQVFELDDYDDAGGHQFDGDAGVVVTIDRAAERIEVTVRWVGDGGRSVTIPAPLQIDGFGPPPDAILSRDGVLLLYERGERGTLALILDTTDGHTVWTALLNTEVLSPAFNKHYLAFVTSLSSTGVLAIASLDAETGAVTSNLPVRADHLHSLLADSRGDILLVAEVFPEHNNLHRIVLVNARNGEAAHAFHLPMAPTFALAPRDWGFSLTPDERTLLTWQSPRDKAYRTRLALQLAIFSLTDRGETKIRYLLTPYPVCGLINYDFPHSIATLRDGNKVTLLSYPPLNLSHPAAGAGETVNAFNSLSSVAASHPPVVAFKIHKNWVYAGHRILQFSTPPLSHSAAGSGWSTPRSVYAAERAVVDAGELAKRLLAMQGHDEDEKEAKGKGVLRFAGISGRLSGALRRGRDSPNVDEESAAGERRGWRRWFGYR